MKCRFCGKHIPISLPSYMRAYLNKKRCIKNIIQKGDKIVKEKREEVKDED